MPSAWLANKLMDVNRRVKSLPAPHDDDDSWGVPPVDLMWRSAEAVRGDDGARSGIDVDVSSPG